MWFVARLLPQRHMFVPSSVYEILTRQVTLGEVSRRVLMLPPLNIILRMLHTNLQLRGVVNKFLD